MNSQFTRFFPGFIKRALKSGYYFLPDLVDRMKGRDSMTPPPSKIFIGIGNFKEIGQEFKRYFVELANLQPNDRVLEVGSGIGRMAVPLTDYLSKEGEYCGLEIVKMGVEWCQKHISPKFENFHFQHIDVYNKAYNKNGETLAKDFRFPFEDDTFNFVFLTSVFTHMLPADVENYLSEICRVLKPGGMCLITFFLLNEESTNLVRAGQSSLDFKYEIEGCLTTDSNNPESAMAYKETFVTGLFEYLHLTIIQPIHYGSWCKRDRFLSYQDIVVATKSTSH